MGWVALEGMRFYAYHGYYEEERLIGGYYRVDLYLQTNFSAAASEDDLEGTLNYETVYRLTKIEMQKSSQLIEKVAARIVQRMREQFEQVSSVRIRLYKEHPPVEGPVAHSYVEMEESYVRKCGKCGAGFLSHSPGDCWTKHGLIYPETRASLSRMYGGNICKRCLKPYIVDTNRALPGG